MRIGKLTAQSLVSILFLFGPFAFPCFPQRSAKSWDELVQYQAEFLREFYPESVGKKYWITFEAATTYDEVGNLAAPKNGISFDVDVGDGPKSQEMMCCVAGSMGGIIGTNDQERKPAPLPPKPKPRNLGPRGEVYPNQYLRAVFTFDTDGRLLGFRKLPNKPPEEAPNFWEELKLHPDMSDSELKAAYKKSGAKYALGDREALERDLPVARLEQFLGKLKVLKVRFTPMNDERIDALRGFSDCDVYLEGPDQKRYVAFFNGLSGFVSLLYISEKDRKDFWDEYFNRPEKGPG